MKWIVRFIILAALALGGFLAFMLVPGYLVDLPAPEASAPLRPATPDAWRQAAQSDLAAIKKLLEDNTPIPFDTEHPAHGRWLAEGYAKAQKLAAQAQDENGHFFALSFYVNGFQDPHINFDLSSERPDPFWPGFIAAKKGAKAVVVYRDEKDPQSPQVGTVIQSCDGLDIESFAQQHVLPFSGNSKIAQSQRQTTGRVFLDRHNPFAARAASCVFETPGGPQNKELVWREIPKDKAANDAWFNTFRDSFAGPRTEWGVTEPASGVTWIGVPTFSTGEDTAPKLKKLIDDVKAKAATMRQGRAIVIDTRGNGGGSTHWSERLTAAIFPDEVTAKLNGSSEKSAADWRASEGNARYWRWAYSELSRDFGTLSFESLGTLYLAGVMRAHKNDVPPIWRFPFDDKPGQTGGLTLKRPKGGTPPFPAKVYFLSNGSCGSTCLNFADQILMIPSVKLIGSATSGDSAYMEVRSEPLPSGLARLTFPQKVWRGMGRGNLEAYQPDIAYDGSWEDQTVRKWVLAIIDGKPASAVAPCESGTAGGLGVCRLGSLPLYPERDITGGASESWGAPLEPFNTLSKFGVDPLTVLPQAN